MSTTHPTPKRNDRKTHISTNPLRSRLWAPSGPGFKRGKDDWTTPRAVLGRLNREFGFNLDAAPLTGTPSVAATTPRPTTLFSSAGRAPSGSTRPTAARSSTGCARPTRRAARVRPSSASSLPAPTHDYVMKAAEIRLIRGRLKFGGASSGAPFPSAIVVFQPPDRCPAQPVFKAVER